VEILLVTPGGHCPVASLFIPKERRNITTKKVANKLEKVFIINLTYVKKITTVQR
jgi:hypothetical protein